MFCVFPKAPNKCHLTYSRELRLKEVPGDLGAVVFLDLWKCRAGIRVVSMRVSVSVLERVHASVYK